MQYSIGDRPFVHEGELPTIVSTDGETYIVRVGETLVEVYDNEGELSDGHTFDGLEVKVATEKERLILERFNQERKSTTGAGKQQSVKAPMPGLVKKILATKGIAVTKLTPVVILEAMKMENVLLAGSEGVIQDVRIEEGKNVEKNTILFVIE